MMKNTIELSNDLVTRARQFASLAHAEIDQKRKYTNQPYIVHPAEVAALVSSVPGVTEEMIAAAWLHDVVEDTPYTLATIFDMFGPKVNEYVMYLTNISKPEDGNRKIRKAIDREYISSAPAQAKTIKIADLISNTSTIVKYDPNFARVYLKEKRELLEVLRDGDTRLWNMAMDIVDEATMYIPTDYK